MNVLSGGRSPRARVLLSRTQSTLLLRCAPPCRGDYSGTTVTPVTSMLRLENGPATP